MAAVVRGRPTVYSRGSARRRRRGQKSAQNAKSRQGARLLHVARTTSNGSFSARRVGGANIRHTAKALQFADKNGRRFLLAF